MSHDQENRVRRLEDEDGGERDIVITVQHETTQLDENGERRKTLKPATDYEEGEWSNLGDGTRMRVRKPRYD